MAASKYLKYSETTGTPEEAISVDSSSGAADAGKIVALNNLGQIDSTMLTSISLSGLSLPFYLANGSSDSVNLTSDGKLPFFLANGTQDDIDLVT